MNQKEKIGVIAAVIVVPLLLILAYNVLVVQPSIAEGQAEGRGLNFPTEIQDLRVTGDAELNKTVVVAGAATFNGALTANSTATFNGAATANSTLAVVGNLTLSGFAIHSTASITPTDGGTLTPSAELVTLTPAAALGTALDACTTGSSTVLYNSVNAAVVITDTGNFIGAGNATLGQYDALGLVCIGAKWVQTSAVSAN